MAVRGTFSQKSKSFSGCVGEGVGGGEEDEKKKYNKFDSSGFGLIMLLWIFSQLNFFVFFSNGFEERQSEREDIFIGRPSITFINPFQRAYLRCQATIRFSLHLNDRPGSKWKLFDAATFASILFPLSCLILIVTPYIYLFILKLFHLSR